MDVENGWRISRFVEHRPFDYEDLNDMVRAVMLFQKLHKVPARVRWNFDLIKKAEEIRDQMEPGTYGRVPDFEEIRERSYRLYELAKTDGIRSCYIHGDARNDNFLINKEEIYLIDWEYGGYGDPGFDIGSYVCGGNHTVEDVDRILFTYFRRTPTLKQKRHFYAYIGLTGFFYLHWVMIKESKGQKVGFLKDNWHHYAMTFGKMALAMYEEEV
jgi:thiamine kinase-like enzyme